MFLKVLFTGVAAAALALAQMGGGGGGGGMGGGGGDMGGAGGGAGGMGGGGMGGGTSMPRAQKETKAELMADRLKLNKDQKLEFQSILESTLKDADPQIKQLLNSRNLLASAMISGKSDEIAVLTKAMNDAQFQMIGVEVMAFRKVVGILKPNQVAKAPEAFDLMSDIFLPIQAAGRGGMGGMGGGGGRGRGGR